MNGMLPARIQKAMLDAIQDIQILEYGKVTLIFEVNFTDSKAITVLVKGPMGEVAYRA